MSELTQARLKDLLRYDPDTGLFTWRCTIGGWIKEGKVAGGKTNQGYIKIKIDRKWYRAHRLAFLYMEGKFPGDIVDHINRVRDDNRWCNLRHADVRLNQSNRNDSAKFTGVCWRPKVSRWLAHYRKAGKQIYIGMFKTHFAACYARHAYEQTKAPEGKV